jgi:twitching motility protein PilT
MYPPHERQQVCLRLSRSLAAVVSQALVPRKDNPGRVAALEIMVCTPTVQKYIEDGKPGDVYAAIEEGEHWGMQTKNQALLKLYAAGAISGNHAMFHAGNYTEMRQMIRRFDGEQADEVKKAEAEAARAQRAAGTRQQSAPPAPSDPTARPEGSSGG